jgi:hypothetical protein
VVNRCSYGVAFRLDDMREGASGRFEWRATTEEKRCGIYASRVSGVRACASVGEPTLARSALDAQATLLQEVGGELVLGSFGEG